MSYVSGSESDRKEMLKKIGVSDFSELIEEIPENLRLTEPLNLPQGIPEFEVIKELKKLSDKSKSLNSISSFQGGGAYDHYVPAAVDAIISRSEFLTAYTPYQAEVSQGTLQTIYEFQSLVCRLTGMDIANASMYDGASATAEAVLMSLSQTRNKTVFLSAGLHPAYRKVIETYTSGMDLGIITLPENDGCLDLEKLAGLDLDSAACVVVQSPNFYGLIENIKQVGSLVQNRKALFVTVCNPLSLALLTSPGEAGADLAVGEMQVFGNALNFGGPYVGYFAANKKFMRKIPGRIAARTKDVDGKDGFVLTLQTREQHIRRDKATSNICTNQALCALAATIHIALLGEAGVRGAALESVKRAHYLAEKLSVIDGFELVYSGRFFNEFLIKLPLSAETFVDLMEKQDIIPGIPISKFYPDHDNLLLVAVTEKKSKSELDGYIEAAAKINNTSGVSVG